MCLFFLLLLLISNLASAAPNTDSVSISGAEMSLQARQIVEANPTVQCCISCQARYDASHFQQVFTNLCTWAGNNMAFSGPGLYYTFNYYCPSPFDQSTCIHLEVQHLCGGNEHVTYTGCMGYFGFIIDPPSGCGGPPFPGAHVTGSDGCWAFQATADRLSDFASLVELGEMLCDPSGRWCTLPGSNTTVNAVAGPEHEFSPAIHL